MLPACGTACLGLCAGQLARRSVGQASGGSEAGTPRGAPYGGLLDRSVIRPQHLVRVSKSIGVPMPTQRGPFPGLSTILRHFRTGER